MKQSNLVNGAILIVLIIISYLGYTEKALWMLALVIGAFVFWVMILLGTQNNLEKEGTRLAKVINGLIEKNAQLSEKDTRLSKATKSLLEENERLTEAKNSLSS